MNGGVLDVQNRAKFTAGDWVTMRQVPAKGRGEVRAVRALESGGYVYSVRWVGCGGCESAFLEDELVDANQEESTKSA
jgi:hypothetical protein